MSQVNPITKKQFEFHLEWLREKIGREFLAKTREFPIQTYLLGNVNLLFGDCFSVVQKTDI